MINKYDTEMNLKKNEINNCENIIIELQNELKIKQMKYENANGKNLKSNTLNDLINNEKLNNLQNNIKTNDQNINPSFSNFFENDS